MLPEHIIKFVKSVDEYKFAKYIDHTLLKPNASIKDLERVVEETRRYGFACLVLSPHQALIALKKFCDVPICSVIGFPLGYTPTKIKVMEAEELLSAGAREVDMVMNIQAFKSGDYDTVIHDIQAVADVVKRYNAVLKVIIETSLLNDEEKIEAVEIVAKAGAHYVKTCTGFLGGGATIHDVILLHRAAKGRVKVKASGGIRHAEETIELILAGADRIGTSTGAQIVEEYIQLRKLVV